MTRRIATDRFVVQVACLLALCLLIGGMVPPALPTARADPVVQQYELVQLTHYDDDRVVEQQVLVSGNGKKAVFETAWFDAGWYVVATDGTGEPQLIWPSEPYYAQAVDISYDGGEVLLLDHTVGRIYLNDSDITPRQQHPDDMCSPLSLSAREAVLSGNGRYVFIASEDEFNCTPISWQDGCWANCEEASIWRLSVSGGQVTTWTELLDQSFPDWLSASYDGSKVAFSLISPDRQDYEYELYVSTGGGSSTRIVPQNTPILTGNYSWVHMSADGSWLVFSIGGEGGDPYDTRLAMIRTDGSGETVVPLPDDFVVWWADVTRLRADGWQLLVYGNWNDLQCSWLVNRDGSGLTPVVSDPWPGVADPATLSYDGGIVAFSTPGASYRWQVFALRGPAAPDLSVDEFTLDPAAVYSNAGRYLFPVDISIRNSGEAPASNVMVRFSDDSGWSTTQTIPHLDPETSAALHLDWDITNLLVPGRGRGNVRLTVTADPDNQIIERSDLNNTNQQAVLVDGRPTLVEVDADYAPGWFMAGVQVRNTFYVTVDWNGPAQGMGEDLAGWGFFDLNGTRTTVAAGPGQARVAHEYDMGGDLRLGLNDLAFAAENMHHMPSETILWQPGQTKVPAWLYWPGITFEVERIMRPGPDLALYRSTLKFPPSVIKGAVPVPKDQAGPLGGKMGPTIPTWELGFEERSDGQGLVRGIAGIAAEIKDIPFRAKNLVGGEYSYGGGFQGELRVNRQDKKIRLTKGTALIYGAGKVKSPKWPLPPPFSIIGLQLAGGLEITALAEIFEERASEELAFDPNFVLRLDPLMEGIALAGEKGLAYLEAVVGTQPRAEFQFFEEPFWRSALVRVYLRVAAGVLWFERAHQWTWRFVLFGADQEARPGPGPSVHSTVWRVAERDYLTPAYASFVGDRPAGLTGISPIITSTYPYADPAAAYLGDGRVLALWVHDDPTREPHQALELRSSRWDGTAWSPPAALTDDLIIDFQPALAATSDGALAVWTRFKDVVSGTLPISPNQVLDQMEIAYAAYDAGSNTWSTPQPLTDNAVADLLPGAAGRSGSALVLWLQDPDNDFPVFPGDPAPLSEGLYYALWDGADWAISPTLALTDVATAEQPHFAYDGSRAVLAWSGDTDGNPVTMTDTEIFYTTWDVTSTAWTPPQALSADSDADLSPRVVYDSHGVAHLLWVKEVLEETDDPDDFYGQLYHAAMVDGSWLTPSLVLQTPGIKGLVLTSAWADGQDDLIAVWRGASEELVDLYSTVYDADDATWSQPVQLTESRDAEWAYDAVYDELNDDLFLVLLQREVLTEVVWVEFPTGTSGLDAGSILLTETVPITIPVFSTTNMLQLVHHPAPDLTLTAEDIALAPRNPLPGETVLISATVHNVGDLAAHPVKAAFYDGDPDAGGTPIGTVQELPSPLPGGLTATLAVSWTVPSTPTEHTLYVRVDPLDEVAEGDEGNNTASLGTVLPDLVTAYGYATYPHTATIVLSARISNTGSCLADEVLVEFRQGSITGTLLGQQTLVGMAAGQAQTATVTWDISSTAVGTHAIFVLADPADAVVEADELNNVGILWADILPDLTLDAYDLVVGAHDPQRGLPIEVSLHNVGNTAAQSVTVAFYDGSISGTLLLSTTVLAVPAAGTVSTTVWLSTAPGIYQLYVLVDPANIVAEMDESNNAALKQAVMGPFEVYLPLVWRGQQAR